jgi:IS30 family transposase
MSFARIDEVLGSTGYFTRPFASWEQGSNENFNDQLRQYLQKKCWMANITDEDIKMIENSLGNHPRKRLGFITTAEVFHQSLFRIEPHA